LLIDPQAVAQALHTDATKTFWIASSYLLANAVCQPIQAALADIWGRRAVYWAAVCLFTIGTIVCCTTHDFAGMIAGRVIQGIGGGGIISVNLIILSDIVPLRQRSKYQGQIQLVFALGTNLAPIIGGALLKVTWRWYAHQELKVLSSQGTPSDALARLFYINLPFCAIGLAIIPFLLRYERPQTTLYDKMGQVDWIGSAMFIVSATVFLVGISWGGNQFRWGSAAALVPLTVGILGLVAVAAYERMLARTPFLRLSLFSSFSSAVVYVCTMLQALLVSDALQACPSALVNRSS